MKPSTAAQLFFGESWWYVSALCYGLAFTMDYRRDIQAWARHHSPLFVCATVIGLLIVMGAWTLHLCTLWRRAGESDLVEGAGYIGTEHETSGGDAAVVDDGAAERDV